MAPFYSPPVTTMMASHSAFQSAAPLQHEHHGDETSFSGDDEPLDPQGYGALVRLTIARFRNDRPELWAGLGMDSELIAAVRYNPIENHVELPLCRAEARAEAVRAFMIYFWAHTADADMSRLHFYFAR